MKDTRTFLYTNVSQRLERRSGFIDSFGKELNNMRWHFFATFTGKWCWNQQSAERAFKVYFDLISKRFPHAKAFYVTEPHSFQSSCYNIHAFVYLGDDFTGDPSQEIRFLQDSWLAVAKPGCITNRKSADVRIYDYSGGACYYVLKWVEYGKSEYDFLP
jgi:hypothetical protein